VIVRARFKPAEPVAAEVVSIKARMLAMAYFIEEAVERAATFDPAQKRLAPSASRGLG
jgi:hypothetical protein